MNLLPLLYALLAALTGFSADAGPSRHGQVAAASAVTVVAAAIDVATPPAARVHLAGIDVVAITWRDRAGFSTDAVPSKDTAAPLPLAERPARRRE